MTIASAKIAGPSLVGRRPGCAPGVASVVLVGSVALAGVTGTYLEAAFAAAHHPAAIRRGIFLLLLGMLTVAGIARATRHPTGAARVAELRSLSRNLLLLMYGVISGQQVFELLRRSWHDGAFDVGRAQYYLQMPLAEANAQLGTLSAEYAAWAFIALLAVRGMSALQMSALPPFFTWETSH